MLNGSGAGYKKLVLLTEEASEAQFKAKFMAELTVFIKHKSIVKNQYDQVLELKSNLKRDKVKPEERESET